MSRALEGKVGLVTGASSGIGRAIAVELGRLGASVTVASRTASGNEETAELVREAGGEALPLSVDLSTSGAAATLVDRTVAEFGRLDCAVNNAARVGVPATAATQSEEEWEATIRTNLTGTWLCMREELRVMLEQDEGGAIVNVASAGGLVAAPMMPAYSASKAGVMGITRTAAIEFAAQGIRINAVCPGPVETPMTIAMAAAGGPSAEDVAQMLPVKRVGRPDEVAAAAVFLCTEPAAFITGIAMPVDGGMAAG